MLTNSNFCPVPWTGLMYNFDGIVKNCIRSADTMPIGDIKINNIGDIVLGDENQSRQSKIINKLPVPSCHTCKDLENNKKGFDIISDRVFYIRELKNVPVKTYEDGNFDLYTTDIRWTNLCNQACVYCGPKFSSRWASELNTTHVLPTDQQRADFKEYIFKHAKKLKHVYLAGGEPLLMKENLELLDLLDPNVNLRINTNLSKIDTKIFDLICKFKNVHWTVSVETIEEEYEYVRYGGSWQDFLNNLHTIKGLDHKISFNMLYFLLNYQSMFTCVEYLKGLGFHNNSFIIGALLTPDYLNIRHLPKNQLQSIKEKLINLIKQKPGFLLEDSYKNLLSYITTPYEANLSNSFRQLALLDQRRGLDSSKIFTELYQLKENNYGQTI